MGWIDAGILLTLGLVTLVAGHWASKRICEALDWLVDDIGDAARLSDEDREAIRRELQSR
jgi:hypothetical protein